MKTSKVMNYWTQQAMSVVGAGLICLPCLAAPEFGAADLRCEYGRNPTAIEETRPRLSWVVETGSGQRGVLQSAYRVLVASSREQLSRDQGDLWDSGKVSSDQSLHVAYAGKALVSGQTC